MAIREDKVRDPSALFGPIEQAFLKAMIESQALVSIYLRNGICLKGTLLSFDSHVLFLKSQESEKGHIQAIFKEGVSTVAPEFIG